jgi:hypothetical protein
MEPNPPTLPSNEAMRPRIGEDDMSRRLSRTYKLRLSDEGIALFLSCHCRLAHIAKDFISYGMTLAVAVTLLHRLDSAEIAAELERLPSRRIDGPHRRFVGGSARIAEMTRAIAARLAASDDVPAAPAIGRLHDAALLCFESAEALELDWAYRAVLP